jgi:hypothetical protein
MRKQSSMHERDERAVTAYHAAANAMTRFEP